MLKSLIVTLLIISALYNAALAKEGEFVEIPPRTLPGYRLNQTNSILMEQSFRRMFRKTKDFEKIEVKLYCFKKWKIPGRTDAKTYQCEPRAFKVMND